MGEIKRRIPYTVRQYSVLLIGGISSLDGEYKVIVMQALMEMGVFERDIAFVFVFITSETLQKLKRLFSCLQIYFTSSISPSFFLLYKRKREKNNRSTGSFSYSFY
jgi:hypothetical protein